MFQKTKEYQNNINRREIIKLNVKNQIHRT